MIMKTSIVAILLTQLFDVSAYANYNCKVPGEEKSVDVIHVANYYGGDTSVFFRTAIQNITFYGQKTIEGDLYKRETVKFMASNPSEDLTEASLTITHQPKL